jgi:hypothetical protein
MRNILHPSTVLTLQSCALNDNRSRNFLFVPHIAPYYRFHVTDLCCYMITEAEVSTMRHKLHPNTVLRPQCCAIKR